MQQLRHLWAAYRQFCHVWPWHHVEREPVLGWGSRWRDASESRSDARCDRSAEVSGQNVTTTGLSQQNADRRNRNPWLQQQPAQHHHRLAVQLAQRTHDVGGGVALGHRLHAVDGRLINHSLTRLVVENATAVEGFGGGAALTSTSLFVSGASVTGCAASSGGCWLAAILPKFWYMSRTSEYAPLALL